MNTSRNIARGIVITALAAGVAPLWAVSLSATGPAQPLPDLETTHPAPDAGIWTAGSATLVPVMATDTQAKHISSAEAPAAGAEAPVGKPLDDVQFVRQATESGRKEVAAARDALPQLKDPALKDIAQMLVSDHTGANERLSKIAETKGWPLPAPKAPASPPAGTASSDFDARWTAEMIAGHERSVALYRAQAQGGDDQDLRKYARDTLPTIERHLAQLRSLQK